MPWIRLAQDTTVWHAVVSTVRNLLVSGALASWVSVSF